MGSVLHHALLALPALSDARNVCHAAPVPPYALRIRPLIVRWVDTLAAWEGHDNRQKKDEEHHGNDDQIGF